MKRRVVIVLACILSLILLCIPTASTAATDCATLYDQNGWVLDMCPSDPGAAAPMQIVLDGESKGEAALLRIYHRSQATSDVPQVAVIYASGFVRLKQNADPTPLIPFGSSFILGPAYWPDATTYYHNPQLQRLEIDTSWLPHSPLRMRATGTNAAFDVSYTMELPLPRDQQTRLHVTQRYTARTAVTIDATRRAEHQGFKLAQVSSMFVSEGGPCDDGFSDCHDSNAARYIGGDLARHQTTFKDMTLPGFIFDAPLPLGNTWLDALHTDDASWQGNTPNVRIALDELPADRTITPQGWISATTDPDDDNVNLWLHDDGSASQTWQAGQTAQISYWLLAQDDPPEPWADLGLRTGRTFQDFEDSSTCFPVLPSDRPVSGSVAQINGYADTALQLNYSLGTDNGNWAQVRCNFDPPLDLSAFDHLRFDWRGDPAAGNSLEVGLINPTNSGEQIFARGYHHVTQRAWWGQLVVPFSFLEAWTEGTSFDPSKVSGFFVSVIKDNADDAGGGGSVAIDNLDAFNVAQRSVPSAFELAAPNQKAATAAAAWLARQQQDTGLLKSWQEDAQCLAYTYDQALALIVFAKQGMWSEADQLVDALGTIQNADGSWFQTHDCSTGAPTTSNKWEGDIAWAIHALSRYHALGGTRPQAKTIRERAADWLVTRINPADGCLKIDHTEATIDTWWALHTAGYQQQAEGLKNCLLTSYWDADMGRFKGGRNWWQPYLDNQTWGAAFFKAIGKDEDARRALSYAWQVLRLPAQGGQLYGFDGQAGPWAVWNEGSAQYAAVGGAGATDVLQEVLAQQRADGAVPGSPDNFSGGGVWTARWHGVAPTAWLYNALACEPFATSPSDCPTIYLPALAKQ